MTETSASVPCVLLVDDDVAFVDAVECVVGPRARIHRAASLAQALAIAAPPDAVFVELALPDGNGARVIREFGARWPCVPSVALTVSRARDDVLEAFRSGAKGYLFKEDGGERIVAALDEVLQGGAPMSRSAARWLLSAIAEPPSTPRDPLPSACPLTARELEVLTALADGCTYEQIAATLHLSLNTVRTHVRNIYEKLSVGSRTEAVVAALRMGIVPRT